MRKGLLASLSTLLAGTSFALAQPPAAEQTRAVESAAQPPAAGAMLSPSSTASDDGTSGGSREGMPHRPPSPYWPNPLAKLECLVPGGICPGPGKIGSPYDQDGRRTEVFWLDAEFLLWWVQNTPLHVPLVTAGSPTGFGILGNQGTRVLFGGSDVDFHALAGARFTGGFWFDRGSCFGLEASGFFLQTAAEHFNAASSADGSPVLARPVINSQTGAETVELISAPNVVSGRVSVSTTNNLYGWDVNFVDRCYKDGCTQVDLLGGFRYVYLDESINILQNSTLLPGGIAGFAGSSVVVPGNVSIFDRFATVNRFYGPQAGLRYEYRGDRLFVNFLGKVALGDSHESERLSGASASTPVGGGRTTVVPGGLLVLASNAGRSHENEFAVVPELNLNVGYHITPLVRAYVGYSFLYWSDVARPGDQISRTVNPALVPTSQFFGTGGGTAQPAPTFQRTDFWAQGINLGLEFRY
jgi:hypothetical protein